MKKYDIYTDGSCYPNPGEGGWSFVCIDKETNKVEKESGYNEHTTNNRMELKGMLRGLEHVPDKSIVTIYSDSQYAVNSLSIWVNKKRKNKIANSDFINEIKNIEKSKNLEVNYKWVRGHSGNKYNEMADELASKAREKEEFKEKNVIRIEYTEDEIEYAKKLRTQLDEGVYDLGFIETCRDGYIDFITLIRRIDSEYLYMK